LVDILTFHGFFGAKFDILKPRWLPTLAIDNMTCRSQLIWEFVTPTFSWIRRMSGEDFSSRAFGGHFAIDQQPAAPQRRWDETILRERRAIECRRETA
jgi:hypothetical protein